MKKIRSSGQIFALRRRVLLAGATVIQAEHTANKSRQAGPPDLAARTDNALCHASIGDRIRKREVKGGAFVDFALCPGSSAVAMHNPPHVGQADSGPFEFIRAVEPLKHPEELLCEFHIETGPVVPNAKLPLMIAALLAVNLNPRGFARARVFHRVGNQVEPGLLEH